jgi:hypothetical protein
VIFWEAEIGFLIESPPGDVGATGGIGFSGNVECPHPLRWVGLRGISF